MSKPRRLIELVVRIDESKPRKKTARSDVIWVVACEEGFGFNDGEGVVNSAARCLERVAVSPMAGANMHTQFGTVRVLRAWSETAAADMFPGGKKEDRPVLDAMGLLRIDFAPKAGPDLFFG